MVNEDLKFPFSKLICAKMSTITVLEKRSTFHLDKMLLLFTTCPNNIEVEGNILEVFFSFQERRHLCNF